MDIKKLLLYSVAALLGVFIWMAWQKDYPQQGAADVSQASVDPQKASTPENFVPLNFKGKTGTQSPPNQTTVKSAVMPVGEVKAISVDTDVLHIRISNAGGNIIDARLPKYPVSVKEKNTPVQILTNDPTKLYVVQSGISGKDDTKLVFSSLKNSYVLEPDQQTLIVTLTAQTKKGVLVTKIFTFTRGSYAIRKTIKVTNNSHETWEGGFFNQMTRRNIGESPLFSR